MPARKYRYTVTKMSKKVEMPRYDLVNNGPDETAVETNTWDLVDLTEDTSEDEEEGEAQFSQFSLGPDFSFRIFNYKTRAATARVQ